MRSVAKPKLAVWKFASCDGCQLSLLDLEINSVYNTYRYTGLPPTPIASPSLEALRAVAFPAETSYLFFRAKCDTSGFHEFTETFEEHLQNACP